MKKITTTLVICIVLKALPLYAIELTENKVIDLALKSLTAKQAIAEASATATIKQTARSTYDTNLDLSGYHQVDKSDNTSPIFGDRTDTTHGEISLGQHLPSGTDLGVDFTTDRTKIYSNLAINGQSIFPADAFYEPILSLSLRQPLVKNTFGYRTRREIKKADSLSAAAELTSFRTRQEIIYNALAEFWTAVLMKRHIRAINYQIASSRTFLKVTKEKFGIGMADKPDLLAAKASLTSSIAEKDAAEVILLKSIYNLRTILDVQVDEELTFSNKIPDDKYSNKTALIKDALVKRPDLAASKKILNERDLSLQTEKNRRWPTLDLVASLSLNKIDSSFVDSVSGMDNPKYQIGLEFSFPLQNRAARAGTKKAEYEKAKALYALKQLENSIINGVAKSYDEYSKRTTQVKTLSSLVRIQRLKLKEELKKYQTQGRSSAAVISKYEQDLSNSQVRMVSAEIDHQQARLNLLLAIAAWEDKE